MMTQDEETLREAVARAIGACDPDRIDHALCLRQADAAIATMFERLRTPSEGMIEAVQDCGPIGCCIIHEYEARGIIDAVATAFQQENSDA